MPDASQYPKWKPYWPRAVRWSCTSINPIRANRPEGRRLLKKGAPLLFDRLFGVAVAVPPATLTAPSDPTDLDEVDWWEVEPEPAPRRRWFDDAALEAAENRQE